jgi:N-acetylglucosamine-6-sulfatase
VRTEGYKYVEYGNGEEELYDLGADPYDLGADPYELVSLHETADPSLLEDLRERLEALKECSGDRCRESEDGS